MSTQRLVALDTLDEYIEAWEDVQRAVRAQGGRAWLFRAADRDDHFLEFIEWSDAADPLSDPAVQEGRAAIEALAADARTEEWYEYS